MNFGAVFPQTEYPGNPEAIKEYAQTTEELGYEQILAYDHILGANPQRPGGWSGPYTHQSRFQEPLVLFSFMAGVAQRLRFATGVIILPQRQTAVFAKQAATLDSLSGGRLRVGIGLGWNEVEYTALNENFNNRGRRIEEQVEVLRLLWTQELVNYSGRWHMIPDAGLNPMPVQRPIPIWFGGYVEAALRRMARLGDGWMTGFRYAAEAAASLEFLKRSLDEAGRTVNSFGIEVRLPYGDGDPKRWIEQVQAWQAAGATHLDLNTMGAGFTSPQQHLNALRLFAGTVINS